MQKIAASLVGAAAVGASLLALRPLRIDAPSHPPRKPSRSPMTIPAGESVPCHISLERLRELGL
jgi:hypothetical protein